MSTTNYINGTYSNSDLNATLTITESSDNGKLTGSYKDSTTKLALKGTWHWVDSDENIVLCFQGLHDDQETTVYEIGGAGKAAYDSGITSIDLGVFVSSSGNLNKYNGTFSSAS